MANLTPAAFKNIKFGNSQPRKNKKYPNPAFLPRRVWVKQGSVIMPVLTQRIYIVLLYVHEDIMGNTRYHSKDNGQSYAELEYDVWGNPTSPGMLLNNDNGVFIIARFTGHQYDTLIDVYFAQARFYDAKNRQWMSSDPMKDGLNWYLYVGANPASFSDPWGLIPTAREAAVMADHIYNATLKKDKDRELEGGWYLHEMHSNLSLKIGVYAREVDGVLEYALVNKGTTVINPINWHNNFYQPFGTSIDMRLSISFAKKFVAAHEGFDVTMVGHSKGGAEAIANAVATKTSSITFNTMVPHLRAYFFRFQICDYTAKIEDGTVSMNHYVVTGDILNYIFGTPSIGKVNYLDQQK